MISREEILNLATLARLKLSDAEVESLQKDISSILDYVGQIASFTGNSKTAPLNRNSMREDVPYLPAQAGKDGAMLLGKREALLSAFPEREGDYNVVRKIIEK